MVLKCECFGCPENKTQERTVQTVLDGHIENGRCVVTREGEYTYGFCDHHAAMFDRNPESVEEMCYGYSE